jgi:outer membrane lipopolysaccharide assembly protein LptE/RlpB
MRAAASVSGGRAVNCALRRAGLLLAVTLLLAGCGYHTTGRAVRLPQDMQTIAIPAFQNKTATYNVEQVLTGAVVREFISRTHYKVVNQEDTTADATLRGTVVSTYIAPVTYDSQTGRASTALVTITMRVSLVDRKGKVLYDNPSYLFREQYQISREPASFFQEESPAVNRLSLEFARTLVSNILEAY